MPEFRAALRAALLLLGVLCFHVPPAAAQDILLSSPDGDVQIEGTLLGFDGEFYRVDTIYGELTVDGSGVICDGPGCPDLENFVARIDISGSPSMIRLLLPALIEAYAAQKNYAALREEDETAIIYRLSEKGTGRLVGEFTLFATTADEAFADLLSDTADIAVSRREVRDSEITLGREAGLGDLSAAGRSRVVALDALVPIVAPENPLQDLTVPELSDILSGKITNWSALGGADAPISLYLRDASSGLGQATVDALLGPVAERLTEEVVEIDDPVALRRAVLRDPFGIGVTNLSEAGDAKTIVLSGKCGFAIAPSRLSIKTEDYPLSTPMFMYFPARRFPALVRDFLGFTRDPYAQLVIRRAGFVDQAPEEIPINAQGDRFANAIAQAGTEVSLADLQRMVETLGPYKRLSISFRFEAGSTRLDAQSRSNVQQLAKALETGLYDGRELLFVGFSDGDGGAGANLEISQRRAEVVLSEVRRMAETANFERVDLAAEAFGEALPMACDASAWGRQVNRRVEVWVR